MGSKLKSEDPRCVCKDEWNVKPLPICGEFTPWEEDDGCAECCHDKACHGSSKDERIATLEAERDAALERVRELRAALIETVRALGGLAADDVSDEFLTHAPGEATALRERVRELTEWRPMESAPRDGKALLLHATGFVTVGRRFSEGAWSFMCVYGSRHEEDSAFRGWLPLPEAPK